MVRLASFVVLTLVVLATCQDCEVRVNGPAGAPCNGDFECEFGLECNNDVCTRIVQAQPCGDDGDCDRPYPDCIRGKCDVKRLHDEVCVSNEQCFSNACGEGGRCVGYQEGLQCNGGDNEYRCHRGLYCRNDRCIPQLKLGDPCFDVTSQNGPSALLGCQPGTYCDRQTRTCTAVGSLAVGGVCSRALGCPNGYNCIGGQCVVYEVSAGNTCENDNDCTNAICDCVNGENQVGVCSTALRDYAGCDKTEYHNCLAKSQCSDYGVENYGTCANFNCKCEWVKYNRCLYAKAPATVVVNQDLWNELGAGCPSGAATFTWSALAACFAVAVTMMFTA